MHFIETQIASLPAKGVPSLPSKTKSVRRKKT